MKVDFDPTKDEAYVVIDSRFDYGEERSIALGYVGDRLYVCIFADRESVRRIISLRKANSRELRKYAKA